jgi:hypothetical protein
LGALFVIDVCVRGILAGGAGETPSLKLVVARRFCPVAARDIRDRILLALLDVLDGVEPCLFEVEVPCIVEVGRTGMADATAVKENVSTKVTVQISAE